MGLDRRDVCESSPAGMIDGTSCRQSGGFGADKARDPVRCRAETLGDDPDGGPLVSVIMSNFNGALYLEPAVASVLGQSHRRLELIVVDDASTDNSLAILQQISASDDRLKIIALPANAGPAGARNAALDAAQGAWIAIVDADDLIHPLRIERLLVAASTMGVDMIADDLVSFGAISAAGQTLLEDRLIEEPMRITSADLIRSDTAGMGMGSFGYLKPMIRRDVLGPLRYDETLRVGEDFDLYSRLLLGGADFMLSPDPTYLYRRHTASVSHRLSVPVLERLVQAHDSAAKLVDNDSFANRDLQTALAARRARLVRALRYQSLVDAIKARKIVRAVRYILRHPALLADLAASVFDRLRRTIPDLQHRRPASAQTVVLASPERLALMSAPPDAVLIPVEPIPAAGRGALRRSLACRLARLSSEAPIRIIAEGPDGLDGLGYVPLWRSAHLSLDARAAREATLPQRVVLEVLPDGR